MYVNNRSKRHAPAVMIWVFEVHCVYWMLGIELDMENVIIV